MEVEGWKLGSWRLEVGRLGGWEVKNSVSLFILLIGRRLILICYLLLLYFRQVLVVNSHKILLFYFDCFIYLIVSEL